MIQRIQSLLLVLIAVAMGVVLSFPIWEKSGTGADLQATLTALQYTHKQGVTNFVNPVWYIGGLALLIAGIALFTVFQYRKRLLQMGLCAVNAILLTAMMGVILYATLITGKEYGNPADQGHYRIGFYAVVAALIANALANRFIRRDERLVRDSDRLR